MNKSQSIKILSLTVVITACCLSIQAQPFQGWRGENRDGVYHETGLLKSWPANGPQLLWETNDAGKGYSSPVIVGDNIFVTGLNEDGDKEVFSAFSLDGKKRYTVPYGTPWKESFSDNRSTPTRLMRSVELGRLCVLTPPMEALFGRLTAIPNLVKNPIFGELPNHRWCSTTK